MKRWLFLAAALLACTPEAHAEEDDGASRVRRFEFKRQNTGRGTESESTKTTLRFETLSDEGALTQLRLDIPLPDEKTDFEGSPFNPKLGDIKIRASTRSFAIGGAPWIPYIEITFPTADPETGGSGKYQVAPGLRTNVPWRTIHGDSGPHKLVVGALVQQIVSFAGAAERKDINYTKFELTLRDNWGAGHAAKLTLKPMIDWVQNGKTGAVAELEGSTGIGRDWRVTLMGGGLLWGEGVQGTYGKRLELTLARIF